MSDSKSISSDDSNDAIFSNDFIESIPDDSDSSESEDDYDMNVSPLTRPKGRPPGTARFKGPLSL
ncbi:hypothetical protein C1646_750203 [Rhizophagus diaphanus]|nr:hypothetical protein C1646_750203 [Rhizophagus diaphanus] [Rhizophagus sp. MUCL 43196]